MEYGHTVAPSDGRQQMEEPRTEADVRSVVGDEEEHHEKKPMMTRMRNRMRKMKDSMTKKMHGHVDDHDVHDDDEHSVEAEAEAEHIDHGIQDSLGGRDDPHTLSSRDDRPVTLASRDQDVSLGGLGSRDERPVSLSDREERATLGGLQEPPVAPETVKDTALDTDPLRNRSVSRTDDGNISDPETGNERSVSPDVLSHFRDMDISSDVAVDAKDAAVSPASDAYAEMVGGTHSGEAYDHIDTPGSIGHGVEVEPREGSGEKGSYTEKLPATSVAAKDATLSTASDVYAEMVGGTHSGEAHDQIATPGSIGHDVEVEPREGAGAEKGSYTEKLPATPVPAKDATLSAASAVYAKVAGGTHSGETHDQIATPGSIGHGVEVEPREGAEEGGSYTEKLPATSVAAKDATVSAASALYAKIGGGTHSPEANDQIDTPGSTGTLVDVEAREGDEEEKESYTENLPATHVPVKAAAVSAASAVYPKVTGDDQIATPGSTGPAVEVEPTEGAEEEKGSYTEKLPAAVAVKEAASTVYAKVADYTHFGETHDQIATPVSTVPGVEVEPREGAEEKGSVGSYTEKLPATAVTAKDAAVSAASTVYAKVAGGTHSGETDDQIATPVSTGRGVEVEPREDAGEEKGSYTEKLPTTPVAAKDAVVSAASAVYAKVAGDSHSGETHDQIVTPGSTGTGVEVEPREGAGEKEGTYMEQFTGAAWAVYGKMMGAGTAGDGTEHEISESKKNGVEEHEVVEEKEGEVKGRIVLPEVTAGEIGVNQVVGKEGGGDGGKGMMGMFNRAVNSMVGGDGGSGGQVAAAEGAGGGAAKERAHE